MHPDLEQLKIHVDKLSQLLADPHEGLSTWNVFVLREWEAMIKLYDEEKKG